MQPSKLIISFPFHILLQSNNLLKINTNQATKPHFHCHQCDKPNKPTLNPRAIPLLSLSPSFLTHETILPSVIVELNAGMKISRIFACTTRFALLLLTPADIGRESKEPAPPTNAEALLKLDAEAGVAAANDRCNEVAIADDEAVNRNPARGAQA